MDVESDEDGEDDEEEEIFQLKTDREASGEWLKSV